MKKLISILLASVISMSALTAVSVSADTEQDTVTVITEPVQPRYTYTSSVYSGLSISNGKATCTSKVTGKSTATKIVATQYLQKKTWLGGWTEIAHWDKTVNSNNLYMSNSKDNLSSGTYRVKTVATVYSGSNSEVVSSTSNEVKI